MSTQILQNLAAMPRRLWDALAIPLLGAVGLWLFVKLVLVISRGLFQGAGRGLAIALTVFAGFLLFAWVALKPERGLYLLFLSLPLTNESVELSFVTLSLPNILLVTTGLSLMLRRIFASHAPRAQNPIFWPKFFLWSWLIGATVISAGMAPNTQATARFLITRIGYALTFLVILALVSDTEKLRKVLGLWVWSATVAAIVTIVGGFFPYTFPLEVVRCNAPLLPILNTPRCSAFNLSFHASGSWLLVGLAAILGSIAYPELLGISRRLAVGLALLLMGGLVIGQVRGAWVALLLAVPIMVAVLGRPKDREGLTLPAYFILVGLVGIVTVLGIWSELIRPIVAMRPENFYGRLESYRIAMHIFGQHWLFGIGPLDERYLALESFGYNVVDNSFIVEIAATGVLGAVPFLLLWFGGFRSCIKGLEQPAMPELHQFGGILGMGLLFLLFSVQAYVAVGEKTPWMLLGLAAGLARIQASTTSDQRAISAVAS